MSDTSPAVYRNLGALAGAIAAPSVGLIVVSTWGTPRESLDVPLAQTGMLCGGLFFGMIAGAIGGMFGGLLGQQIQSAKYAGAAASIVSGGLLGGLVAIWLFSRL